MSIKDTLKTGLRDSVTDGARRFLGGDREASSSRLGDAKEFTDNSTKPARLGPANNDDARRALLGAKLPSNLLYPLYETNGIVFPYTPDVQYGKSASYDAFHFTHSNYQYHQYAKTAPTEIQITSQWTAQSNEEGHYLTAALRFLSASSMMEFGKAAKDAGRSGTPPPVLRFNYLGDYMFSNIPVVITNFSYLLEKDVDYVGIRLPPGVGIEGEEAPPSVTGKTGGRQAPVTYVPTRMILTVQLQVQQNPKKVRENFDLEKFRQGQLVKKGFL